jgi:hypothetical protein
MVTVTVTVKASLNPQKDEFESFESLQKPRFLIHSVTVTVTFYDRDRDIP